MSDWLTDEMTETPAASALPAPVIVPDEAPNSRHPLPTVPDRPAAIWVQDLHRRFGDFHAVRGVSFRVEPGQVVGFVGANGAGKTTTMRILATLDYPTGGGVFVGGYNVVQYPAQVRRLIGWVPDAFGTYEHMTVIEYLDFYARALGFRGEDRLKRIKEVVDFTDLGPLASRLINKMSKGQSQRLCLGRALLHDPQILIMDEPAAGLDPKARVELKNLIRILSEEGKTILISSHILSELGEMCDSLLFIDKGRIVHHGDADSLKRGTISADQTTVIHVEALDPGKLRSWALTAPHVSLIDETKQGARLRIDSTEREALAQVLRRLIADGIEVVDFHREERKLEDAFIDILGEIDRGTFVGTQNRLNMGHPQHRPPQPPPLASVDRTDYFMPKS
jgi:ABC-2 type transport system ATP-binding protein